MFLRNAQINYYIFCLYHCVDTFCCVEVDSFSHFSMRAKTGIVSASADPKWNAVWKYSTQANSQFYSTFSIECFVALKITDCVFYRYIAGFWPRPWGRSDAENLVLQDGEPIRYFAGKMCIRGQWSRYFTEQVNRVGDIKYWNMKGL